MPDSSGRGDARQRRRLTTTIKESMRDLGNQLTLLNHHVGSRLEKSTPLLGEIRWRNAGTNPWFDRPPTGSD